MDPFSGWQVERDVLGIEVSNDTIDTSNYSSAPQELTRVTRAQLAEQMLARGSLAIGVWAEQFGNISRAILLGALADRINEAESTICLAGIVRDETARLARIREECSKEIGSIHGQIELLGSRLEALRTVATSQKKVSDTLNPEMLHKFDLENSGKMTRTKCDEFIELLLNAYGHASSGETRADQRDARNSTWELSLVPREIEQLVELRFLKASRNKTIGDVLPYMRRAMKRVVEQIHLEQADFPSQESWKGDSEKIADRLIAAWDKKCETFESQMMEHLRQTASKLAGRNKTSVLCLENAINTIRILTDSIEELSAVRYAALEKEEYGRDIRERCERAETLFSIPARGRESFVTFQAFAEHWVVATEGAKDAWTLGLLSVAQADFHRWTILCECDYLTRALQRSVVPNYDALAEAFPRLVLLERRWGKFSSFEPQAELMKILPHWAGEWIHWLQQNEPALSGWLDLLPLRRQLVAFGRLHRQPIPFLRCLGIYGNKRRATLSQDDAMALER